jgi:hypothetical protein
VVTIVLHHSDTPDSRKVGDKGFNVCFCWSSVVDPDPGSHHSEKLDPEPDPHQFADDEPKCMKYQPIFGTFSRVWALIRTSRIRIRINVMRIHYSGLKGGQDNHYRKCFRRNIMVSEREGEKINKKITIYLGWWHISRLFCGLPLGHQKVVILMDTKAFSTADG